MPSLKKALQSVEELDHDSDRYLHAKASIYNEIGRVHVMVSQLDSAASSFIKALEIASGIPQIRLLHFDIKYNLSSTCEQAGNVDASCSGLRLAAVLLKDMLDHPAKPPQGYGANGEQFLTGVAVPRVLARQQWLGCSFDE